MPLVWNKKVFTLRQLNPTQFKEGDPAGDAFFEYEWQGFSGLFRVCRVVCTLSPHGTYGPIGKLISVSIKSKIIGNRFWAYEGRADEGTYTPPKVDDDGARELAEKLWAAWLLEAGLEARGK